MSGRFVRAFRTMQAGVSVVAFRRIADRRGLGRFLGGGRRYEVAMADGTLRKMTLRELDALLDARHNPADFWACVDAADRERDHQGDREQPPDDLVAKRLASSMTAHGQRHERSFRTALRTTIRSSDSHRSTRSRLRSAWRANRLSPTAATRNR